MNPIAIELGGLSIHWYGVMIAIGFMGAVQFAQKFRDHARMSADDIVNLCIFTMISGIIGARINYVISYPGPFEHAEWWRVFAIWEGGLVFYGGFIAAFIFIIFYCRLKKQPFFRFLDILAIALPFAHAFGRVGCFLQGCCFGTKTDSSLGFTYPNTINQIKGASRYLYPECHGVKIHAVQLYEAACEFTIFGIMLCLIRKRPPGQLAALYMILYSIVRFVLEYFRGEYTATQYLFGKFSPGQVISMILFPLGIAWFIAAAKFATRPTSVNIDPPQSPSI